MASQNAKRRSRKARSTRRSANAPAPAVSPLTAPIPEKTAPKVTPKVAPKAGPPKSRRQQREDRLERERRSSVASSRANRGMGTYGERPKSIFHPIPVAEFAIFAGLIAVVVGFANGGGPALQVGGLVCAVGVLEFTARDHFSGYRSHTTLLAAFPAVIVEALLAIFVGIPKVHVLVLAPAVPVFALSFWLLRRSFAQARHARVARPPA